MSKRVHALPGSMEDSAQPPPSCLYTGIFIHEFAVSTMHASMALIHNIFEDMHRVCCRYSSCTQRYQGLLARVPDWDDSVFARELAAVQADYPFFEEAVQRSFVHFVRSFFRRSERVRDLRDISQHTFVRDFVLRASRNSSIHSGELFKKSEFDRRAVAMELIRQVFLANLDEHVIFQETDFEADGVAPSDSISNVCLGDDNKD